LSRRLKKIRQQRSRIVQTLNEDPAASPLGGAHRLGGPYSSHRAPQRIACGSPLAAALLNGLLSILREWFPVVPHEQIIEVLA